MPAEIIICIPGPWKDRSDLVRSAITLEPAGTYMFAGGILAHPVGNDHIPVVFSERDGNMGRAFHLAGQGRISDATTEAIASHESVVFLIFPADLLDQRERILKFTNVFKKLGGYAVKIDSCGVAHEWDRWISLLSGSNFDIYCSAVTLVGDTDHFYSCGMHHFGLADCQVPRSLPPEVGAELLNQFNFWRLVSQPELLPAETFSTVEDAPRYRMLHSTDTRHDPEDIFHNPHGIWTLAAT